MLSADTSSLILCRLAQYLEVPNSHGQGGSNGSILEGLYCIPFRLQDTYNYSMLPGHALWFARLLLLVNQYTTDSDCVFRFAVTKEPGLFLVRPMLLIPT
jgi:hypothetical protein